jgi:hypothetical protein
MILYQGTAEEFSHAVETNQIIPELETAFNQKLGRKLPPNEISSFTNSLSFMERVVRRAKISEDCGVLVEYIIPLSSNRIDFLIAGKDKNGNRNFIIVELKQWQEAEASESNELVYTFLGGAIRDTPHPSYQAYSYKSFLADFNEYISQGIINAHACAYLHNLEEKDPEPLKFKKYRPIVEKAPLYFRDDQGKLEKFLEKYVSEGQGTDILYQIESGKIKPTKKLIDHVTGLFEGNKEFVLLDEQKVAFEKASYIAKSAEKKSVVIIKGGPGTGKSVISVNLLGELLKNKLNTVFVAPNAAFRNVMVEKLSQDHPKTRVKNLFKGSSSFHDISKNTFDALVIDEAHRLKDSSAFMYQGKNQIQDIIKASKTSIFLIDDDQVIRPEDIGSVEEIKEIAERYSAEIHEIELKAQFRCSGAEGYINWLADVLHLEETANYDGWDQGEFEFKIFDDPNKLKEAIEKKQEQGYKSRLLAGYSWDWTSAKNGNPDAEVHDVQIPEYNFEMAWNSRKNRSVWAIKDEGKHQVGCIHTAQGLEFDYVGVIVGNELSFDPENLEYITKYDKYKDLLGKRGLKDYPEDLSKLIRNIYKVLMTRGMKGCYLFFMNDEVESYFRERLAGTK